MSEEKYNGWTNRETWTANQWLNEEEHQAEVVRRVKSARDPIAAVEYYARGIVEDSRGGFRGDLIGCALGRVNWPEIAEGFAEAGK